MSLSARAPSHGISRLGAFVERRGTLIAAAVAGVLAVVLLSAALKHDAPKPAPVATADPQATIAVAKGLVRRGSLFDGRIAAGAVVLKRVPAREAGASAITSLAALRGKVASADVLPGEAVTADVLSSDRGALSSRLTGGTRAVSLPIDAAHGMVGDVHAGDRVDVYGSFNVKIKGETEPRPYLKLLAQDVEVLRAPKSAKGSESGDAKAVAQVTLDLGTVNAQRAAFTADNGKLWIAARPASGANASKPKVLTIESLLFGVEPIVSTKAATVAAPTHATPKGKTR